MQKYFDFIGRNWWTCPLVWGAAIASVLSFTDSGILYGAVIAGLWIAGAYVGLLLVVGVAGFAWMLLTKFDLVGPAPAIARWPATLWWTYPLVLSLLAVIGDALREEGSLMALTAIQWLLFAAAYLAISALLLVFFAAGMAVGGGVRVVVRELFRRTK